MTTHMKEIIKTINNYWIGIERNKTKHFYEIINKRFINLIK